MNPVPLPDILLTIVLALQVVGLLFILIVWRRQNSSDVSSLKNTCDGLQKGQERLEAIVRDEMEGNRREAGEQARVSRGEMGISADKLTEQFAILQRDNLAFGEQLSERLSANFNAFAHDLAKQVEAASAADKEESAQLRGELFKLFDDFGTALTRQMTGAIGAQDRRFEKFEKRLIAVGERNADQIHSMDDAIVERLETLQLEFSKNWDAKLAEDAAAIK